MKSYQNIYSILTKGEKQNFKLLILMMFFAMILETLGIASILPIINLLTNQNPIIIKNSKISFISILGTFIFIYFKNISTHSYHLSCI